jgi:hypothetical protein
MAKKHECERFGHEYIAIYAKLKDNIYRCRYCGLEVVYLENTRKLWKLENGEITLAEGYENVDKT